MVAPRAKEPVTITVDGPLVSKPYIHITLEVIRAFSAEVQSSQPMVGVAEEESQEPLTFTCMAPQTYQGREYEIEPDASAASYFWGTAAVTHGRVTVEGLSPNALQGDVGFCDCLAQMGCTVTHDESGITVDATDRSLRGIDVNMNAISDTVQTLAVIALFAEGPTRVRGVAHNRHKETDRIGDLACELRKLGATVEEFEDGLEITPGTSPEQAAIATYNDHRMAMSFALAGLRLPNIAIMEPSCTVKTYPHYFDDLKRLVGQ